MGGVNDLPRKALDRTLRLAKLPFGVAGRATVGFGKRLAGKQADEVMAEMQRRTADQIFRTLGELKGGAMKVGQALSIMEAAIPEEWAGPYRATLTKLQDSAPPLPAASVHNVLATELGPTWRSEFADFDDSPAAAASIGQVHRAVWNDGREVAVKIQYPGAGDALRADLSQIGRVARLFGTMFPGLDVKAVVNELKARMSEELDYSLEASAQQAFATAYADDPEFAVPRVVRHTPHVLISEWQDGRPLSDVIGNGTTAERNRAGLLYTRFMFSGPARAGLLHADPHPGNFRITPDGRLGVVDFGLVSRLPDGLPPRIGRLLRIALDGDYETVLTGLREEGFIKPNVSISADELYDYLNPFIEPARQDTFQFSRDWMRAQFDRIGDPRSRTTWLAVKLNLPPSYVLIHRVWLGGAAVLSQLNARAPFRAELEEWLPGFTVGELAAEESEQL